MNDWITFYSYSTDLCEHSEGGKHNVYNEVCSDNSLDVCICLTKAWMTDWSHWWWIDNIFIEQLDPKIVLPHRCQILRLMNKIDTSPVHNAHRVSFMWCMFMNSLQLWIERRTLASHSSALTIKQLGSSFEDMSFWYWEWSVGHVQITV